MLKLILEVNKKYSLKQIGRILKNPDLLYGWGDTKNPVVGASLLVISRQGDTQPIASLVYAGDSMWKCIMTNDVLSIDGELHI